MYAHRAWHRVMVVALTANAQNTLRDNGSFTLQPKVGIGVGSLDGTWTTVGGVDRKSRIGFLAGAEAEYYTNEWLGIAAGLNYAQQGWKLEGGGTSTPTVNKNSTSDNKYHSGLVQFTIGYKFQL